MGSNLEHLYLLVFTHHGPVKLFQTSEQPGHRGNGGLGLKYRMEVKGVNSGIRLPGFYVHVSIYNDIKMFNIMPST